MAIRVNIEKTDSFSDRTAENLRILDMIDLLPYLLTNTTVNGVMAKIEEEYNDSPFSDNELLEGDIFAYVYPDEFVEYLRRRYPDEITIFDSYEVWDYKFNAGAGS